MSKVVSLTGSPTTGIIDAILTLPLITERKNKHVKIF